MNDLTNKLDALMLNDQALSQAISRTRGELGEISNFISTLDARFSTLHNTVICLFKVLSDPDKLKMLLDSNALETRISQDCGLITQEEVNSMYDKLIIQPEKERTARVCISQENCPIACDRRQPPEASEKGLDPRLCQSVFENCPIGKNPNFSVEKM